jgi:hypothetical protein
MKNLVVDRRKNKEKGVTGRNFGLEQSVYSVFFGAFENVDDITGIQSLKW